MKVIFSILFFLVVSIGYTQVLVFSDDFIPANASEANSSQLPEGLLQGKAAVIYLSPFKDWKNVAGEVQRGLQKAGVDGVAHFHIDELYSGKESKKSYQQLLIDREIDFLVFYNNDTARHTLMIAPFQDSITSQVTYKLENKSLKDLLHQLYLQSARSKQELTNLLILEVPAYMNYPTIIKARRAEFYDLNMKSGKLAIPKTADSVLNRAIDSIMTAYYPYDYGFVEPGMQADELRKDGYWFIMYGIHGSGKMVRNLLEYNTNNEETAYASVVADNGDSNVKTFPVDRHVFKFYIKDVQNNDVYLGKHYDADTTWEAALKNYIMNLRNILAR